MVAQVGINQATLDPDCLVFWDQAHHQGKLIQGFMKLVYLLLHQGCVEPALQELIISVEGLIVAVDGSEN